MGVAGFVHMGLFGALLPLAVLRSKRILEGAADLPSRRVTFAHVLMQQLAFAAVSVVVARIEGVDLWRAPILSSRVVFLSAGLFCAQAVVGYTRSRARVARRDARLWLFMPNGGVEVALWAAISLAAGFGEEITYRVVLPTLCQRAGLSLPWSVVACAVVFGVSHATQSWTVAGIVTLYALGMHLLVSVSNSVFPAMVVHAAHDLWVGYYIAHRARRTGWFPDGVHGALGTGGSS